MQCFCGFTITHGTWGKHFTTCPTFWDDLATELRRISDTYLEGKTVSQEAYRKFKRAGLPSPEVMLQVGKWTEVLQGAGIDRPSHRIQSHKPLPPPPESWPQLLQGRRFISPYATKEHLYNLVTSMVQIAQTEAAGHLAHHVSMPYAERRIVQREAQEFLEEWRQA